MMNFKFLFSEGLMLAHLEVSTNVLFGSLALLGLGLAGGIFYFRRHYASKQNYLVDKYADSAENTSPLNRKYEEVSVFNRVPLSFRVGGAVALAVVLLVINWTIYSQEKNDGYLADLEIPTEVNLDPPATPPTPPPPALPPPPPPMAELPPQVTDSTLNEPPKEPAADTVATYDPNNKGKGDPNSKIFTPEPPKPVEIKRAPVKEIEEIIDIAQEMPLFPYQENIIGDYDVRKQHADMKMLQWIYGEIKYPNKARDLSIEGTVVVSFVIDSQGNMSDVMMRKKIGGGCEEEAERVVRKMASTLPKWTPARQNGRNVSVRFNLPIRFKLKN
jgi:periplasmic protein TonB